MATLDKHSIGVAAQQLAASDPSLAAVLDQLGPPPLWKRPATFSTFVRIILEQQVSLAAGKTIFDRVVDACDGRVTAEAVAKLGETRLRPLGLSRQKARYAVSLAHDVNEKRFRIAALRHASDDEARSQITARLGLGNWSADVFLMMALCRPDLLPVGDLALVKGMSELDGGRYDTANLVIERAEIWRPYRSVATRMVWQSYLAKRRK